MQQWFALGTLIFWPVVVFIQFGRMSVQKAIVFSFVTAWLFIPPIKIGLPGVPDWSKTTATVSTVLVALLMKQPDRLLAFRPRWFDLPVLGFSGCSFFSAVSSGMGPYEGLSSVLENSLQWGLPYLIGRIYLADKAGARQLASGIVVGGLVYVPLCLLEIRLSPILKSTIFGTGSMSVGEFGYRYGGYRPAVFLASGLELGWWMCCASLCAYLLTASRSVQRWFHLPAVPLAWTLALVSIACKSTGALVQIGTGALLIGVCRYSKKSLPLWLLLLIPPVYCLSRPSGYCSGQQITSVLSRVFPPERIQSMEYRFAMEDLLIGQATRYPILGWSRMGQFNPMDENGRPMAVADGYWIMIFCSGGGLGLILLIVMSLLPTALFLKRYPVQTWMTPQVAPLLALATVLALCMIDNLSNAMINPIYAIALGVLTGCSTGRRDVEESFLDHEASPEAEDARLVAAIHQQMRVVQARPYGQNVKDLASLRAHHARSLAAQGRGDLALTERSAAENLWRSIEPSSDRAEAWDTERAANANDLAWLLACQPGSDPTRLEQARRLVEAALLGNSTQAAYWNTLGIVCFRQGDHHRAVHALSRSVTLGPDGGTAFDFYFLALANRALGYGAAADTWRDRAESWSRVHPELDQALSAIRAEVDDHAT